MVALGSEPYLASAYGIVKLRSQPLTAAAARFREYLMEAERSLVVREQELLERWRPRPVAHAPPRGSTHPSAAARRRPGPRA
jgi:hypothetical protein